MRSRTNINEINMKRNEDKREKAGSSATPFSICRVATSTLHQKQRMLPLHLYYYLPLQYTQIQLKFKGEDRAKIQ